MFALMFVVAWIVAEVVVFVEVARALGVLLTLLLLIGTSLFGAAIARRQRSRMWVRMSRATQSGGSPPINLVDGPLLLLASVFIAIPGFLSDGLGLLLLIPGVRTLIRSTIGRSLRRRFPGGRIAQSVVFGRNRSRGDVIDGEVLRPSRGSVEPPARGGE